MEAKNQCLNFKNFIKTLHKEIFHILPPKLQQVPSRDQYPPFLWRKLLVKLLVESNWLSCRSFIQKKNMLLSYKSRKLYISRFLFLWTIRLKVTIMRCLWLKRMRIIFVFNHIRSWKRKFLAFEDQSNHLHRICEAKKNTKVLS